MHGVHSIIKDDFLSAREVCDKLKISYVTLGKWRKDSSKRFPVPRKVGRQLLFSVRELDAWYFASKDSSPKPLEDDLSKSINQLWGGDQA